MFRLNESGDAVEWVVDATALDYPPSASKIKQAFAESEFGDFFWLDDAVNDAAEQVASGDITSEQVAQGFTYVIAEKKDAQLEFEISDDSMTAILFVVAPFGGQTLTPGWLKRALHQAEIAKGIDVDAASRLLRELGHAKPGQTVRCEIAHGAPPLPGKDGYIKVHTRTAAERMLRPKKREDGSVDMRDLGDMVTVALGDPLIERIPPETGQAGFDVRGKPISPPAANDVKLSAGEGASLSPDNPDLVIAAREGCPVVTENSAQVDDVMQVEKVDVSTGHVRFKGTIYIKGDVGEGMLVEADGDVQIEGCIESARVFAGGSITVQKGIIGHQRNDEDGNPVLSCHVEAKHDIVAQHAQYSDLKAEHQVTLLKQCNHCNIVAGDNILIGQEEAPNGRLVGGDLAAGRAVRAGEIGTAAGAKTSVDLNLRYRMLREQLAEYVELLKSQKQAMQSCLGAIQHRKKHGNVGNKLEALLKTYSENKKMAQETAAEARRLKKESDTILKQAQVEIAKKLHSRLYVRLGRQQSISDRDFGPCRVAMKEGTLQIIPQ